jgi:hypothetical protein
MSITSSIDQAPEGKDLLQDAKYGGYRIHARIESGCIKILTGDGPRLIPSLFGCARRGHHAAISTVSSLPWLYGFLSPSNRCRSFEILP